MEANRIDPPTSKREDGSAVLDGNQVGNNPASLKRIFPVPVTDQRLKEVDFYYKVEGTTKNSKRIVKVDLQLAKTSFQGGIDP